MNRAVGVLIALCLGGCTSQSVEKGESPIEFKVGPCVVYKVMIEGVYVVASQQCNVGVPQ